LVDIPVVPGIVGAFKFREHFHFASSTLALALVFVGVPEQSERWAYPLARVEETACIWGRNIDGVEFVAVYDRAGFYSGTIQSTFI
jgi:hypothetical protein